MVTRNSSLKGNNICQSTVWRICMKDSAIASKGFIKTELLKPINVKLNVLSFLSGRAQLSEEKVLRTPFCSYQCWPCCSENQKVQTNLKWDSTNLGWFYKPDMDSCMSALQFHVFPQYGVEFFRFLSEIIRHSTVVTALWKPKKVGRVLKKYLCTDYWFLFGQYIGV